MKVLGIDTSGKVCTVALVSENGTLGQACSHTGLNHSVTLMPMIDHLLKTANQPVSGISHIALSVGPGSFTGLRIGGATAKGLAQVHNIPIIEVPTLDALAYGIFNGGLIVPIMDARRDQVYTAYYRWHGKTLCQTSHPYQGISISRAIEEVKTLAAKGERVTFLGDGALLHQNIIEKNNFDLAPNHLLLQNGACVATLGLNLVLGGKAPTNDPQLIYVREPQAQRELLKVVPFAKEHLNQAHEIEEASFLTPWSKRSLEKDALENKLAIYLVALKDDVVTGYIGMWHIGDEGHITNVAVSPKFRQKGMGEALLKALIQAAEKKGITALTLEVRVSNMAAINLYKNHGFKIEGHRKNYYTDTKEDALIMWRRTI